jgi:CRISPR-associated protein Cas2
MMVIVVENVPPRLRGRLAVWLLEVRAGVYVGVYGRRTREMIWTQVVDNVGEGSGVLAWSAPNDAGFEIETCGPNRRVPVDYDGFRLVAFRPQGRRGPSGQPDDRAPNAGTPDRA